MRSLRTLARAVGWLLPLAAAACLDDAPVAPGGAETPLRINARVSASQDERIVKVRVYYPRLSGESVVEVDLPVSPDELRLPGGESPQADVRRVSTRISECLVDPDVANEEGAGCPLHVQLTLVNAAGDTLAQEVQVVHVESPGATVEVPSFDLRPASISGVVRNATTGSAIGGATVNLFVGTQTTGNPAATATASSAGEYQFTRLPAGEYTVVATGTGLIESAQTVSVSAGEQVTRDIVASPTLLEGQWRIVLTWGTEPRDLDTHFWGPNGDGFFHIYYSSKTAHNVNDTVTVALLDVDDTSGEGPETVTIRQQSPGTYTYAIYDFTNGGSTTSAAMGASGARVQVYNSTGLVQTFTVPNQPGTLWTVFTLSGETITPVNTMAFATPGSFPPGSSEVTERVASGAPAPVLSRAAARAAHAALPAKPLR